MPWTLDTVHSSLDFSVRHMVISSTKGRFTQFAVDADVDESDLSRSNATLTINAGSIDTRDEQRDAHLRSADFFDAESNPTITFVTKRIEPKGGSDYLIVGDMTIRGTTREIVMDAEANGPVKDPWGGTRVGISASGKINRKDFGLTWNGVLETGGLLIGDDVKLSVDLELVKA